MSRYTLFNTPFVTALCARAARWMLRLGGWRVRGAPPRSDKFIVIAYPHTSNWDVPYTLAICLVYGLQVHWMGKSSLFRGPLGPLMKWLGGIPVYLGESRGTVQQTIDAFAHADRLILIIAPEANRARVDRWKTGFYRIALGAGIPIVLGFLDFARREGGYLETFEPSGDLERDLAYIRSRYRGIRGRHPEQSTY